MEQGRIRLVALGWDHDRCMRPMEACARAWSQLRPHIDVVWERRSLTDFGDQPLEDVADRYDLLVIDHPFCGVAAATGCLRPLDELLSDEELTAVAADAVGPSHVSYAYAGHQWALATDAACQVSAFVPDALGDDTAPATWDDVLALARRQPGAVGLPLSPPHAISSYLTLCTNLGGSPVAPDDERLVDAGVGERAAELLLELARLGPEEALRWEPPDALARLTESGAALAYVPLTYGYLSYSTPGFTARLCRFADIPSGGHGPIGAVLGGAGLAVSATTAHPEEAAAFAAWASGTAAQVEIVTPNGGQPGSATAWSNAELDALTGGFFSATRATMDAAWLRPRDPWWPPFQLDAGAALTDGLTARRTAHDLHAAVESAYHRARSGSLA